MLSILLKRSAALHRHVQERVDLKQLWQILPEDLRRTFQAAEELQPMTLATAIHATVCHTVKPYCCAGAFRRVSPDISHVRVTAEWRGVEVGYWLQSYWRSMDFKDLEAMQTYFEELPAFNISREEEDLGFRFDHWPR
jgi:hypothetical protein